MSKISLAIVDDNENVLNGLKALLNTSQDISIRFASTSCQELQHYLSREIPQLLLMDIQLSEMSGIDLCKILLTCYPSLNILGFSSFDQPEPVQQLLNLGAKGYLIKNTDPDVLLAAIRTAALGQVYVEASIKSKLGELQNRSQAGRSLSEIPLTKRERDILQLLAQEYSPQDIARLLLLPARTVDMHCQHLSQKLGTTERAAMLREANKRGLLV